MKDEKATVSGPIARRDEVVAFNLEEDAFGNGSIRGNLVQRRSFSAAVRIEDQLGAVRRPGRNVIHIWIGCQPQPDIALEIVGPDIVATAVDSRRECDTSVVR